MLVCSQPLLASDREDRLNAGLAALKREHYATALRAWLPLAEAGDPEAQANVGYMYEEGLGVTQQFDIAVSWYEKAAALGSMQANHNLGMIFADGGYSSELGSRFEVFCGGCQRYPSQVVI